MCLGNQGPTGKVGVPSSLLSSLNPSLVQDSRSGNSKRAGVGEEVVLKWGDVQLEGHICPQTVKWGGSFPGPWPG